MSETHIVIRRSGAERRAERPVRARVRLACAAGVVLLAVAGCSTASPGQQGTAGAAASSSGAAAIPAAPASAPAAVATSADGSTGTAAANSSGCAPVEQTYASFLAGTLQDPSGNKHNWYALSSGLSHDVQENTAADSASLATDVTNLAFDASDIDSDLQDSSGVTSSIEQSFDEYVSAVATDCGTTLANPPTGDFNTESW
jgi:hypothetical protein